MKNFRKSFLFLMTLLALTFSAVGTTPAQAAEVTFVTKTTADGLGSDSIYDVFVVGNNVYAATSEGLSISTDGGETFTNKTTVNGLFGNSVAAVYVVGSNVYAVTSDLSVMRLSVSTNGGTSFTTKTTADGLANDNAMDVFAVGSTVYVVTGDGLSISTDGGNTFTVIAAEGLTTDTVSDIFVSNNVIYVATYYGLFISRDGGATFVAKTLYDGLCDLSTTRVYVFGNTVYVGGNFALSISMDGGNTFICKPYTLGGSGGIYGLYANANTVFMASYNDGILALVNGDKNFVSVIPITSHYFFSVYADGNKIYAAGNVGGLYIATLSTTPTVESINRVAGAANPTKLSKVEYLVTFSDEVGGVDTADFKLTNTFVTGAYIESVSRYTSTAGDKYLVTVNTGTGNGTIRLDLRSTATIKNWAGYAVTGPYLGGQTYQVWKGEAPTVPLISAPLTGALVTNTPTLSWGESSAVMALAVSGWHYEVNITGPNGFNQNYTTEDDADVEVGLGRTSITITEPLPDLTTFTWKVRAYNDTNAYSAWSLSRTFKTVLVPELNSPINNETLPNKRPTFEWDEVPGATGYTVQVLKGTAVALTGTVKAPAYIYTPTADLLPNTTYTWRVMAAIPIGGVYSQPLTFTTSLNPPAVPLQSAPASAAMLADTPAQILDWNPVLPTITAAAAMSYEVQYANNSQFLGATFNSIFVESPDTQLTIATLPGRTYYWRVRAYSGAGGTGDHSAWSLVRNFNVKFAAPILLTPTNAATGTGIRPTFTWSANGNGIWTSYTLQVANDPAFTLGLRTFTVKVPKTSYTIPDTVAGLTAGTKYWRVKINGLYVPLYSAIQIFTP